MKRHIYTARVLVSAPVDDDLQEYDVATLIEDALTDHTPLRVEEIAPALIGIYATDVEDKEDKP